MKKTILPKEQQSDYKDLTDFFHHLYEICPDLKKDGLKEFDGYFTSYDNFLEKISQAWGGEVPCYNNDPFELIIDLINERNDLKSKSDAQFEALTILSLRLGMSGEQMKELVNLCKLPLSERFKKMGINKIINEDK